MQRGPDPVSGTHAPCQAAQAAQAGMPPCTAGRPDAAAWEALRGARGWRLSIRRAPELTACAQPILQAGHDTSAPSRPYRRKPPNCLCRMPRPAARAARAARATRRRRVSALWPRPDGRGRGKTRRPALFFFLPALPPQSVFVHADAVEGRGRDGRRTFPSSLAPDVALSWWCAHRGKLPACSVHGCCP